MRFALVAAVIFLVGSFGHAKEMKRTPASEPSRNVQIGGSAEYDACGGSGIVTVTTTLFKLKNGMVSFGKVNVNQSVNVCDEDGDFVGIVILKKGQNCGTGGNVPQRKDYTGPCESGWIKKEYFHMTAG